MKDFKLKYIFSIILLCFITIGSAQKNIKAKLVHHDGSVEKGYATLISKNRIRFKTSKKAKSKIVPFSDFEEIVMYYKNDTAIFTEIAIEGKKKKKIVEISARGEKVSLYKIVKIGTSGMPMSGGTHGAPVLLVNNQTIKNFYVKKAGETRATHLGSNQLFTKNFKKATTEFFKDCPSLVKKIEDKYFKKKDLVAMIKYYNSSCN